MKQITILMLTVFLLVISSTSIVYGQDQFYRIYDNFADTLHLRSVTLSVNDRAYMWGSSRSDGVSKVYVHIIDEKGEEIRLSQFDNADLQFKSVLYDKEKERFIVAARHREGQAFGERILEVDLAGNLTNDVMYEFHDLTAKWEDAYSIVKYKDGYAVAGMVYYERSDLWALGGLTFLNADYTVRQSAVTDSEYHIVENLMTTEDGELWGLLTRVCFPGNTVDCYQRLAHFTEEGTIDAVITLYDEEETPYDKTQMIYHPGQQVFVYDYEERLGGAVLSAIDSNGVTKWTTPHSEFGTAIYWRDIKLSDSGDILLLGSSAESDDAYTSNTTFVTHARANPQTGKLKYRKYYIDYLNEEANRYQLPNSLARSKDGYLYISMFAEGGLGESDLTTLLRVDDLGNIDTDQKGRRQVVSDLDPMPEAIVSSRNIWHIYNADTDEHYRYTFADTFWKLPTSEIALRPLVKSDQMTGEQWYQFGSYWWGNDHQSYVGRIGEENGVTYRFYLEEGEEYLFDYISQDSFHFARHVVLDVDSMQLLDGRTKKVFTLRCKTDPEGTTYGTHTWIEDVGDIDHFSTAYQVCSEVKSEQIVCFYSAGRLLYTNPAFETCIVTAAEPLVAAPVGRLSPNPATEHIAMDVELSAYQIYSVAGQLVQEARASSDAIGLISVRTLAAGVYVVRGTTTAGQPITAKFVKL